MVATTTSAAVAAQALANGSLAALPTETVYGLGASLDSAAAIARIFAVKGRPANHPLIVHVAPDADLSIWATKVPETATALSVQFWPGPLTLVLPRTDIVPGSVTGGQDTVALRAPASEPFHAVLAELTRITGKPAAIAAPSANLYGQVSPTSAQHVVDGLGAHLTSQDVVFDGGPCQVGIESTIVLCRDEDVIVLRPGGVTEDQLATVVAVAPNELVGGESAPETATPRVSGSLSSHYSPNARVLTVEKEVDLEALVNSEHLEPSRTGLIALAQSAPELPGGVTLARPASLDAYATELYAALLEADKLSLTTVVAVLPPATGIGVAIRDRLKRAAHSN